MGCVNAMDLAWRHPDPTDAGFPIIYIYIYIKRYYISPMFAYKESDVAFSQLFTTNTKHDTLVLMPF